MSGLGDRLVDMVLTLVSVGLGTLGAWCVARRQMKLEASRQAGQDEARAGDLARLVQDELQSAIPPLEELHGTASVGGKYEKEWLHYSALTETIATEVYDTFAQSRFARYLPHELELDIAKLYRLIRSLKRKVAAGRTRAGLDTEHYKRWQVYTDDWDEVKRVARDLPTQIRHCIQELQRWSDSGELASGSSPCAGPTSR